MTTAMMPCAIQVANAQDIETDPMSIRYCPDSTFVSQSPGTPDTVAIGYRRMPRGEMKKTEVLLDSVVRNAVGLD